MSQRKKYKPDPEVIDLSGDEDDICILSSTEIKKETSELPSKANVKSNPNDENRPSTSNIDYKTNFQLPSPFKKPRTPIKSSIKSSPSRNSVSKIKQSPKTPVQIRSPFTSPSSSKPYFKLDSSFHTPSPHRNLLDSTIESSPDISPTKKFEAITAQFMKSLESPGFLAKRRGKGVVHPEDEIKPVKKPKGRQLQCVAPSDGSKQCKIKFGYESSKPDIKAMKKEIPKKPSGLYASPDREKTPEHYWDTDIPSYEEQKKRNYVIESDSPLKVKKRL